MTEIPIIDSEPIDTPAVPDGARVEEFVATPHVPRKALPKLAPDGAIPNSVMSRLFKDWGVQAFQRNATKSGVSMSKRISVSTTARPRPSKSGESGLKIPPVPEAKESFLDKLKKAMEEKERKIAELEQAHRATTADEDQEKIINFDDDDEDGVEGGRRRLPIVTRPLHLDLPGEAPQPKYPKIIEKALTFKWFPQDEIFYPPAPTPIDRRHPALPKPKGLLRMKVEPTGEALLSIILDCFRRATSPAVRGEIVSYLNWIHEEFGFRDTTALVRFFCRFLQSVPFIDMDEEEMELRQQIVGSLSSLGFQQIELVPSVLMQTIMPFEKLRAKASATLTAMGLLNDVHTLGKIREIFTDYEKVFAAERTEAKTRAETAASRTSKTPLTSINGRITPSTAQSETRAAPPITQSAGSLDFRNSIMTFLRRTLRKYLIRMAKDDETVAKLRELNESGLIDRSGKKALEEKEKEDLRMMALRERDRLKQAVLTAPVIQNEPKEKEKKKEKGSKKKKGPIVRQDMLERRTTQALVMVNRPKPKQETGPERPTSASSVILNAERGGDKLTQGKSYVTILQNPAVSDFIAALNCYEISVERRLAKEEKERLDRIARETEAAERARLEKEKQDAMADFMRKKEAERLLRVEQMRQRIALARMREESLPKVKSVTKAHGFHTLTRRSKCHGSRETMDYLFDTHHHDHHFHGNFISLHLQKLNKSMPVENVQLSPFGEEASHGSVGSRFRLPGIPEALPRESVFSLHPPKLRGSEQDSERRHDAHIHEEDTGAHHHHVHWSAEPDGTHGRRSSKVPAHAAGDIDSGEGGTSPAAMEVFRSNRKYFVFGTD
ncbi:hypothetical protein DFJ73DRAFT_376950 [Zopfochytrium polystomum]|nr:hypothetical protein DFJ73DRAFT_376950 [Zopfochytrium polystomum]